MTCSVTIVLLGWFQFAIKAMAFSLLYFKTAKLTLVLQDQNAIYSPMGSRHTDTGREVQTAPQHKNAIYPASSTGQE